MFEALTPLIETAPLSPGARVALVAPASAVPAQRLQPAVDFVRALGLEPVVYPSCYFENRHGYLAAEDARRAGDLQEAFADGTVDGVWCIRGGYGAHRLLPLLDLDAVRTHPKRFLGYSDVTALHTAFNQACGFVTYHTVMPSTETDADEFTLARLKRALFGSLAGPLESPRPMAALVPGKASGALCGGNLSLLAASLGTPWELDTRGKLLFLEDIGEKTYRVDAMLTQLRNAGKFHDCAGVILGAWTDCPPEDPENTLGLPEIFAELIAPAGKPAVMGLACGHTLPTLSLPLGALAELDADALTLTVL